MQTADERNGSSNTTIISTTISSTSNENDNHSNDTMTQHHQHLPQAQPIHQHHHQPPGNNETTTPANVLRHRSITSNTRTANKSDLWHLIDAAECLSSNVECIPATPRTSTSVTPSTSPQASPARTNKLKQDLLKLATAGGVGMHSIVISAPLQKNTYKANTSLEPRSSSSSSSSLSLLASSKTVSNSTPTSTTSSVIATPILKRNGDIFNSNNEQSEVANDKGQANDENTKNPVRATAAEAYDPEGIVVSESNDMQLDKNKSKIIPVENDKTADYCKQFRESNKKQQLLTNQKLPYENISPTETINKELSSNTLPVSSSTTSLSITTLCVTDANQQPSASSSLTSSSTASTASVTPVSAAATPALLSTTSSSSSSTSLSATPSSTTDSNIKGFQLSGLVEAELLHWQDMPEYLQFNPYVLRGYRPLTTFKGCLLSLFYWHNETINILTHAIPIVYILAIVPGLMPWESGYRFLSFCHVFGAVAPWCGSFVYHLFMNIEQGENVYNRLLKLDMVGIWVSQSFGALPLVTASTFCFTFKWKWFIIISYCLLSLWGLYKALTASSPWQRRLCFGLPFAMRSVLTFFRTIGLVGGNRVALEHVFLQDGVSIFGGAIGAMRIPEKWFPGLVDFYLNSHNIMHVLVVVAVYSMYKATMKDFEWMETANCDVFVNITSKVIESTLNTKVEL